MTLVEQSLARSRSRKLAGRITSRMTPMLRKPGKTISFRDVGRGVLVASIIKRRTDIRGKEFDAPEEVRIIHESGGYRVDFTSAVAGAWMPWEAVTEEVFKTVDAAKAAARTYTMTPSRS